MARMKKLAVQLRELADRLEKLEIGDVGIDCTINVFGNLSKSALSSAKLRETVAAFAGFDQNIESIVYHNSTWIRVTNGDIGAIIHYNCELDPAYSTS